MVKYNSEFIWPPDNKTSKYTIDVTYDGNQGFVEYHNVDATLMKDAEVVGTMKGTILRRPNQNFFEEADAVSSELQGLAVTFCESNGKASRIKHPKLDAAAVKKGGFFNIYTLEVKPCHRGKDLGLRMLHEILALLNAKWTLAVAIPVPLGERFCKWKENYKASSTSEEEEKDTPPSSSFGEKALKIQRHFCRLGFVQTGQIPGLTESFFITSSMFNKASDSTPPHGWLTKQEAESLAVHQDPETHEAKGLDKELGDLVGQTVGPGTLTREADLTRQIQDLVHRGASIHGARALFIAAAKDEPYPLEILVGMLDDNAGVNLQDEFGCTPLHIAAVAMKPDHIRCLSSAGADASVLNSSGETPSQALQAKLRSLEDFAKSFGIAPRNQDVQLKRRCTALLEVAASEAKK